MFPKETAGIIPGRRYSKGEGAMKQPVAPQMIMHTCGHYGRYHLHGLLAEQLERIAKLEATPCRNCRKHGA